MKQLEELLEMWRQDSIIDRTEPGREIINIPKLHSKYLNILSSHRILSRECEFKYNRMKKLKWEYYTGKLDDSQLKNYGWEPFPYVLKSEITTYLESDEDINKHVANKIVHDEIVDICTSIMKELNSRTYQLRSFIDYEKFIQGI
tara:strand:- start:2978 stop:3412 length:435 start_codon:yes stop_codon:yes gene_type:complete